MYKKKKIQMIVNIQEDEDGYASHDLFNIPHVIPQKEKSKSTGNASQRKTPVDENSKSFSLLTSVSGK
jgi:hypothetical protein